MTRERTTVLMRVCGEARQNGRIDGWQWDQTEVGEDLAVVPMAGIPRAIVKKWTLRLFGSLDHTPETGGIQDA
jgi:hypothetical protein